MRIFYKAGIARCSDIIPFYDSGRFKPFYLKRWPPDYHGRDAKPGWYMLDTEDFVHFSEHDTGISGATGSVIFTGGLYHMFFCRLLPESQTIRHAVSKDLVDWTEIPEDTFVPDNRYYAMTDWRDGFVFYNEEEKLWWMLACASLKDAPTERRGCIALCVSSDLHHWEFRPPFYTNGTHQSGMECPDLFKMGDWYYLLYSNATNRFQTFYRMSRSLDGPWIVPAVDTFDTRVYYAAKTASDGRDRYLFAWAAAKEFNSQSFNPPSCYGKDYGSWDHGGTMIVHKLVQKPDGTLGVTIPESIRSVFMYDREIHFRALQGCWKNTADHSYAVKSPYEYACAILDTIPEVCRISMKISYTGTAPTAFGVALQVDESFVRGYYLSVEPNRQRIEWKSYMRMYEAGGFTFPYEAELERPVCLEPDRIYDLEIVIEGDVVVTYLGGDTVLTARAFDYRGRRLGLFVENGSAVFSDVSIRVPEE